MERQVYWISAWDVSSIHYGRIQKGTGVQTPTPLEIPQVATGSIGNSDTDPFEEQLDPGVSVWPTVKYVDA